MSCGCTKPTEPVGMTALLALGDLAELAGWDAVWTIEDLFSGIYEAPASGSSKSAPDVSCKDCSTCEPGPGITPKAKMNHFYTLMTICIIYFQSKFLMESSLVVRRRHVFDGTAYFTGAALSEMGIDGQDELGDWSHSRACRAHHQLSRPQRLSETGCEYAAGSGHGGHAERPAVPGRSVY